METETRPVAIVSSDAPLRTRKSVYPEPYASLMDNRFKRPLGEIFGLRNFGVNLTRIAPGGMSALRHAHAKEDEFIFVLEGRPTLVTDEGRTRLAPGMCAGFPAGTGNGHHLLNETDAEVAYLEVGDRQPGETATYPDDDLVVERAPDGAWLFRHKDGTPY